ncbi:MAG: TonB family protein [Rhodospirillales bacterium]|nr:TonB family protein [Rhodospirillales bacterium]
MNAKMPSPLMAGEFLQASRDPLSPTAKRALLALVIFFHVGGGWALTQVEPAKLIVGDIAPMEVRMVPAEQAAEPEIENAEPPPPVEIKQPDLAAIVEPPPPDLPPPEFPIARIDIPPPPEMPPPVIPPLQKKPVPKPERPKPVQRKPPAPVPQAPVHNQPQQAAPAAAAAPRVVSASQLGFLVPPNTRYPARARKAGEQGSVMVRVFVDVAGRPAQVTLETSSGHPALDEAAMSAVRGAQFRPYSEGGVPKTVWVRVPINFVLQ